jgi:hypothetical protein
MYIVQIMYFAEKFLVHFSPPSSVWGGVCGWVRDGGVSWGMGYGRVVQKKNSKKKKFQKKKFKKKISKKKFEKKN